MKIFFFFIVSRSRLFNPKIVFLLSFKIFLIFRNNNNKKKKILFFFFFWGGGEGDMALGVWLVLGLHL